MSRIPDVELLNAVGYDCTEAGAKRYAEALAKEEKANRELIDRDPIPRNVRAEQGVLYGLMNDPEWWPKVAGIVSTNDFFAPANGILFDLCAERLRKGMTAELAFIEQDLEDKRLVDAVGGWEYLASIYNGEPHAAHTLYYAKEVREKSQRRKFIQTATLAIEQAHRSADAISEIVARLDPQQFSGADDDRFKLWNCKDFDSANFTLEWLIDDLLVKGQPCLLVGPKKSLKTSLAVLMALRLATGGLLFNKFPIKTPQRVLVFSGESGGATLQETARRQATSFGWSLSSIENLYWCMDLPSMGSIEDMTALEDRIRKHKATVVMLDCAYLMLGGDVDHANLFEMGPRLRQLTRICEATGCTPILLHHTKKSITNPFEPVELDSIAYSGFAEWARQWVLLNRREAFNPEKAGEHRLWFGFGGSAGHGGLFALDVAEGSRQDVGGRRWECELKSAAQARLEAGEANEARREDAKDAKVTRTMERLRTRVLEYLASKPDGDTKSNTSTACKVPGDKGATIIHGLLDDGFIETCTVTKGSREFPGVRFVSQTVRQSESDSGYLPHTPVRQIDSPHVNGGICPSSDDASLGGGRYDDSF
jgi:hypothetical protein